MGQEEPQVKLDIEPTADGIRILLPPRDLGEASKLGLIGVIFGGVGVLFMLMWIAGPLFGGIAMVAQGQQGGWISIAFSALGLIGLGGALQFVMGGLTVFRNRLRCEVTVSDRRIVSREKLGWFSLRTKVPLHEIENLYLRPLFSELKNRSTSRQVPSMLRSVLSDQMYAIAGEEKGGRLIAPAYPLSVLNPLVNAIAAELDQNRVGLATMTGVTGAQPTVMAPMTVVQQTAEDIDEAIEEDDAVLPAGSKLTEVEHDGVTVYRAPSPGLWKGSHGLFPFSLLWLGFMCVFSSVIMFQLPQKPMEALFVVGFISLFWLVGIGLLVGAIYMAKKQVMIGVDDGSLFVERKTIFGTKWSDFEPAELRGIELGPSGVEVNDVPIMELHVLPKDGKKVGMLSQLEDAELRWLAKRLRDELGLKHLEGRKFPLVLAGDDIVAPPGCQLKVNEFANGDVEIEVPAAGLWSSVSGPISAILVAVVPPIVVSVVAFNNARFPWQLVAIGSVIFPIVGLTILLIHYAFRSRSFQIRATKNELEIERRGFMADRQVVFSVDDIDEVVAEETGFKVNQDSKCQIVVAPRKGSQFAMMWGREPDELAYVAAIMRRALGREQQSE